MTASSSFLILFLLPLLASIAHGWNSSPTFYDFSCPKVHDIVQKAMADAISKEPRMGASILRMFFHDCFVNGCDASLLLDDTPAFTGEKSASPNLSVRGFELIDSIKSQLEEECKATVSCADILALAARDSVVLLGGPSWMVYLGRQDSRTVIPQQISSLPPPTADLTTLVTMFAAKNLTAQDMTALSGAHTIGLGRCANFRDHIYSDTDIDPSFASLRRLSCPLSGDDGNLAPIDDQSENSFDNNYFKNLLAKHSLFHSDQELFNGGSQDSLVLQYSNAPQQVFFNDFAIAMVKMGNLVPLDGTSTEIRLNCRSGLNARDMTVLSGAHTIGQARCTLFRSRIFNEANVNASFAALRKRTCPASGGDGNLAPLDVRSPDRFDNAYYQDLVARQGLLHSDQELFNGGSQDAQVRQYSTDSAQFARDFAAAMVKMGNISPLTGTSGEIRLNCRKIN
ncbi:peroxidase P7-like isoform X2 [Phoenix dactylifera]|uniref:peroxidase n=1 Tax=Phoenix dactylifera TaxID=42345 RepID=A0A8B7CCJ9_PHODC|nr:peroxidase P7-like isoform X2 [Phoenix dactylifera]